MESKVLIALIDSLVDEAVSKLVITQGEKGPRGLRGKDGNDFNLLDHADVIRSFVIENIPEIKLTEEQILSLKGERGEKGKDGKNGLDFDFVSHQDQIDSIIKNHIDELAPSFKLKFSDLSNEEKLELKGDKGEDGKDGKDFLLEEAKETIEKEVSKTVENFLPNLKLKFEDLTQEEQEKIRGPRGQRGKPGRDFSLEESKEVIESAVADSVMALAPDLKLKFDDLTDSEKDSLKLKFSELTDDERHSLKGARGQRGKQGIQGEKGTTGDIGPIGPTGKIGPMGPMGIPGVQGVMGPRGKDGVDGKDAPIITDVKVDQDFKTKDFSLIFEMSDGSEVESDKIELPKGDTVFYYPTGVSSGGGSGGTGTQGPPGPAGPAGPQGIQGEQGLQGIQGEQGPAGTWDPTLFIETGEPTGFVNRTDSFIEFNELDRRFVIGPQVSEFVVYVLGQKIVISETLSQVIPNQSGNYYFYINGLGELHFVQNFDIFLITSVAYCGYLYFDAEDGVAVGVGDERHGITMDSATHKNLHTTRGTQLVSGADVAYSLGNGSLDEHAKISLGNMEIADEDIAVSITNSVAPSNNFEQILDPHARLPIWYRQGAIWKKTVPTEFPLIFGTNRAKYNNYNGTGWQLTEAPSNNKVLVTYVFATTNIINPVIGILGQAQYQTIAQARQLAAWEAIDFGALPSPEMKLLYILYYETSTTYNNSVKSRIVFVEDCRHNYDKPVSSSALNDNHSTLLNLDADDHPQYLTQTRADDRYYTEAEIDQIIANLSLSAGINVVSDTTVFSNQATTLNFLPESFNLSTFTYMSDWTHLSDVTPGISTYNTPNATEVIVEVKDLYLLEYHLCDSSVYVGSYVRLNSSGIAVNAMANSKQNSKVLGMVESKLGDTVCNIRIKGTGLVVLSGLDVEEDYWLSPTIAGGRTTIKPTTSGQYAISLGQALSGSSFFVDIGTRLQIP